MTPQDNRIPTVYLSRTGLLEPLGQSQVLSYAIGLSRVYAITLISFERENDLRRPEELERIRAICDTHGIRWQMYRYRSKPRLLAAVWNLTALVSVTSRAVRETNARLIHARSYIPATAAWFVAGRKDLPFIFDMRSLWPEELITSRRLRRGSWLHRLIRGAEGRLLRDASAVVSLTRAAVRHLDSVHSGAVDEARLSVIPTCTDLDRFRPAEQRDTSGILIGCHGSLASGWFRMDLLAVMFSKIAAKRPDARFEIITREDRMTILSALEATGKLSDQVRKRLTIESALSSEIHLRLQKQSLSMFFYASGAASELGRSPTRMGESLGCGVPILTNSGIGDTGELVSQMQVGVVLHDESESALERAADAALAMIGSTDVSNRCRNTAEAIYSLRSGVAAYAEIYARLVKLSAPPVERDR